MAGVFDRLGHLDCESRMLFVWVVAQRSVRNLTIPESIEKYMAFNNIRPEGYERLLASYNKRAREVKSALGINLEACRECTEQ